jgi:hypothetical protein
MMLAREKGLSQTHEKKIRDRLVSKASDFDLLALLRALSVLGYEPDDVFFENSMGEPTSRSLVHSLRFEQSPIVRAVVGVNMGLMGPNGPLPSYFQRFAEELLDRESFDLMIQFFDHLSLKNLFASLYPDYYSRYYDDWEAVRQSYMGICGLASIDRIHWLFSQYIPELPVHVRRATFRKTSDHHVARTGITRLDGTGIVGRGYQADAHGFQVRLHAELEKDSRGRSWAKIVSQRFIEHLQPLLKVYNVEISLSLWIENHESWARLNEQGFLGYERIQEDFGAGHEVVLHDGRLNTLGA